MHLLLFSVIMVVLFIACGGLGYAVLVLLKRIRSLEQKIKASDALMKTMNDVLKSILVVLQGANTLMFVVSQRGEGKDKDKDKFLAIDAENKDGIIIH